MKAIKDFFNSLFGGGTLRFHPSGLMIIAGVALIFLILTAMFDGLGFIGVLITAVVAWHFRDPIRVSPQRDGLVLAPVDGRVHKIETLTPADDLHLGSEKHMRISLTMPLFGMHVARAPISGEVVSTVNITGLHGFATRQLAEEVNERFVATYTTSDGAKLAVVAISGPIHRPIDAEVNEGQTVHAGERAGMLEPMSRVDVYIPGDLSASVLEGQHVTAGETILVDLKSHEPPRDAVQG